ncbi:MAG: hypothetical protein HQK72_16525 [Desulfamplus sp.]|nr:hypothetical protein [Desulfamplus sp.]
MKKSNSMRLRMSLFLTLLILMIASSAPGEDKLPEHLQKKIEQVFPVSKIIKIEEENYKGNVVIEVELMAKNGTAYEVYLTKDGNIVKIEEEDDDFSWFK